MPSPTLTHDPKALELQARSLEALVSLLHALNASNDVDDVGRRALLTVSGQMLVTRVALFVEEKGVLRLRASIGIGRAKIEPTDWTLTPRIERALEAGTDDVIDLVAGDSDLEDGLSKKFDRLARISDGDRTIGVLVLGGWLGSRTLNDADRQLLRTMGVVIGTTLHRVTVQEQLTKARERLEQAQLIRKGVMDHVSHEFNTPLMVVKSVGEILRWSDEAERDQLLDMHDESVERLEELVQSILLSAREIEGASQRSRVSLRTFVDEIVRPWAIRRSEPISHVDVGTEDDLYVEVDAVRVEMILDVLHKNAREAALDDEAMVWVNVFLAPGGWWEGSDATRRLEHYRRSPAPSANRSVDLGIAVPAPTDHHDLELVIEVADVGRGIPENEMPRIFEPFTLASNSVKLGISGAGMGLPTARRIGTELDGRLLLRSRENVGTLAALILHAHSIEGT